MARSTAKPAAEPGVASSAKPIAWQALADRHGGSVDRRGRKIRSVRIPHGLWTIELARWTQGESQMTRMRTRFHTRQPMTLSVFRTNPFYSVLRAFGMQDVSVPNPALDRAYIVRTDHLSATQSLLMDRTLTRALLALRKGRLEVVRERRRLRLTDGSELRWVTSGKLEADEDLENVLALVRSTIDGLLRLGIARVPMSVDDWG